MFIDRLKKIFGKLQLPSDTRKALEGASSTPELSRQLDDVITANEVEFRNLQNEIEELEQQEEEEITKIRQGTLGARSRKIALMRVQRLRKQQDTLEARMRIHDDNMSLHIALLGKVQAVEAMEMRGVEEQQIDTIAVEFQEELDKFSAAVEAGSALTSESLPLGVEKDEELARLEAEIMGEALAADESAAAGEAAAGSKSRKASDAAKAAGRKEKTASSRSKETSGREDDRQKDDTGKEVAWD